MKTYQTDISNLEESLTNLKNCVPSLEQGSVKQQYEGFLGKLRFDVGESSMLEVAKEAHLVLNLYSTIIINPLLGRPSLLARKSCVWRKNKVLLRILYPYPTSQVSSFEWIQITWMYNSFTKLHFFSHFPGTSGSNCCPG